MEDIKTYYLGSNGLEYATFKDAEFYGGGCKGKRVVRKDLYAPVDGKDMKDFEPVKEDEKMYNHVNTPVKTFYDKDAVKEEVKKEEDVVEVEDVKPDEVPNFETVAKPKEELKAEPTAREKYMDMGWMELKSLVKAKGIKAPISWTKDDVVNHLVKLEESLQ